VLGEEQASRSRTQRLLVSYVAPIEKYHSMAGSYELQTLRALAVGKHHDINNRSCKITTAPILLLESRFAPDSPLEQAGFSALACDFPKVREFDRGPNPKPDSASRYGRALSSVAVVKA
jgi:hypothetical protein